MGIGGEVREDSEIGVGKKKKKEYVSMITT